VSSLPPEYPSYPRPDPNQQPYYAAYPAQPGHHGPPPSKNMAGWALGLAMFPGLITWVISIAFASTVISRSKDGRDHGKGMAIAAFVIIGVWVVVGVVVIVALVATSADRDEAGHVTDGGRASVLDLRVGDCLPDTETGKQTTVELVECDRPHKVEVFAVYDLGGSFTTVEEVGQLADVGCVDRFEAFVGIAYDDSTLDAADFIPPDEHTFNKDPGVTCLLVSDEPVTGSLMGSKR
jgi:putative regulator of septum formation